MNILGWSVALSSGVSVVVASITGLVAFWDDTFLVTQWGSYVIYLAVAVLSRESRCTCPINEATNAQCSLPAVPWSSPDTPDITGQPCLFCHRTYHYFLSALGFEETVSATVVPSDH